MDEVTGRVSSTHAEGRAIDGRSVGWSDLHIKKFTALANDKFKDIAAISSADGTPRAVVWHDIGLGSHFHFQCRRNADVAKLVGIF